MVGERGPRRADDHRDGRPHAAGLRDRLGRRHARRRRAGDPPRRAPRGVRQAAGRPAADAQRARRPGARVRGRDGARDAPRARLRRSATPTPASDTDAQLFKRLATAVGKYWICKRAPNHAFEALECLGGNGYVEESGMPRLYREAPLASIWEGSGNVHVPRRAARAARARRARSRCSSTRCEQAAGADAAARRARGGRSSGQFSDPDDARDPRPARRRTHGAVPAGLAARPPRADPAVADAFCASRLAGDGGLEYGTLPAGHATSRRSSRARGRPEARDRGRALQREHGRAAMTAMQAHRATI